MASRDPHVTDVAAFDQLRIDLIHAGFEPVGGAINLWEGPIFDCFRSLAPDTTKMRVLILDGFPHVFPKIFVDGMLGEHVATNGDVCLWTGTDETYTWRRLAEIEVRAKEWVERQREGFSGPDAVLDAHLYFESYSSTIAVFELDAVAASGDGTVTISGTWDDDRKVLSIRPGAHGGIPGRCYSLATAPPSPPRTLDQLRAALTSGQQNNFDRRLKSVAVGKEAILMLSWNTHDDRDVLVLVLTPGAEDSVSAKALEAAPMDCRYQLMRAGPDATALSAKKAVVLGIGAVGSHTALMLGSSGFGHLRLVDSGTIRPGDRARHASGGLGVGRSKVSLTDTLLAGCAPWTKVEQRDEAPWDPERLRQLVSDADLVVEATGYGRLTDLISIITAEAGIPLVSAALYRGGAIGRVRCQAAEKVPIAERIDETRYPVIPPDDELPQAFEPGCSEPVNNASPIRVQRLAGLTADLAVDVVLEREVADDVAEVYHPIETTPFDARGRLEFPQ